MSMNNSARTGRRAGIAGLAAALSAVENGRHSSLTKLYEEEAAATRAEEGVPIQGSTTTAPVNPAHELHSK
ncbi:MAG: hypothetical protein IT558_01480 [Alphaproteobacteria bacterium]|nr:hypothetical protein [Alphaproteobacteria bacterium]